MVGRRIGLIVSDTFRISIMSITTIYIPLPESFKHLVKPMQQASTSLSKHIHSSVTSPQF